MNEYQKKAIRTLNHESLVNVTFGLIGETGEVVDLIKKHLEQGHELNKDKLAIELGDLLWYIAAMAKILGHDLGDIADANIAKLEKRYPDGFEVEKSINRRE